MRPDGEAEATRSEQIRIGQPRRWWREPTVGCLQMDGWVVILACIDVLSSEGYRQLITAQAKGLRIDGERKVLVGGAISWLDLLKAKTGKRAETFVIEGCNVVPATSCLLQHSETAQAQHGIELWHARIEAGKGAIVVTAIAIFTPDPDVLSQIVIIGRDDTPFPRDEQLGGAQAVDLGIALRANWHTVIECAEAVRRIEHE